MRLLATFVAIVVSLMLSDIGWAQMPGIVTGPRPQARVIDETGTLSAADSAEIERLARSIEKTTNADMMVVVIPTTAGEPHRRFATDLFNRWRLATPRATTASFSSSPSPTGRARSFSATASIPPGSAPRASGSWIR